MRFHLKLACTVGCVLGAQSNMFPLSVIITVYLGHETEIPVDMKKQKKHWRLNIESIYLRGTLGGLGYKA